ncbi:LutC/YkgG family protein [Desulfohalovibrio reitneri]|uniref:LutC/YkgG family protein n=1 Tax=Desulfohalovibrio reitneri TaxID=1307759 RepID=UPI000690D587|nr:lactate utilization protein [Desulfohalovibrio reitneri]
MSTQDKDEMLRTFTAKAEAVSCVVEEVPSMAKAFDYVVDLCGKKEACKLLISGCEEALSKKAEGLCETKQAKLVAAPNLNKKDFGSLKKKCNDNGFVCIDEGMRDHLAGTDIGVALCQGGIADTGTVILDSDSEETRLATMISEIFVAVVPKSKLFANTYEAEDVVSKLIGKDPSYTAFITGASRTADIERVLALGVHGPLEMHVLLLDK